MLILYCHMLIFFEVRDTYVSLQAKVVLNKLIGSICLQIGQPRMRRSCASSFLREFRDDLAALG